MTKILLINPSYQPHWSLYEPTSLLYLSSSLKKNNISSRVVDINIYTNHSIKEILTHAGIEYVDFVGITAITRQAPESYKIGNTIRENWPDKKIIYGGVHPTFMPQEPFYKGSADYVIAGEGEESLPALIKTIKSGKDNENISGIYYKNGDDIQNTKEHELIKNLDTISFPDYSQVDLNKYNTNIHVPGYTGKTINMMTSRGCTESCYYCSSPALYRKQVRYRSAENIADEIEMLIKRYAITNIHFADDNFLLDKKRIERLCVLIEKKNLKFNRICLTRSTSIVEHKDILPLLRKSGCVGMEFGVESGDVNVFECTNKNNKIYEIIEANTLLKENDIYPMYLLMSYSLGEKITTPRKTIELYYRLKGYKYIKDLPLEDITIQANLAGHLARTSPGSVFYEIANKKGKILADDWSQHCEEELGFLPNEFLDDVPIIQKQTSKNEFLAYFTTYKNNVQLYINQNFYITRPIVKKFFHGSIDELVKYMYLVYTTINSNDDVQTLANALGGDEKELLTKVAVSLSLLSIFGFITGKNHR
ncbi:MAG: radical SAM protein [Candidatus Absconditabacterales bacterium]